MIQMSVGAVRALPVLNQRTGSQLPVGTMYILPAYRDRFEAQLHHDRYPPFLVAYTSVYVPGKSMGKLALCIPQDDRVLI